MNEWKKVNHWDFNMKHTHTHILWQFFLFCFKLYISSFFKWKKMENFSFSFSSYIYILFMNHFSLFFLWWHDESKIKSKIFFLLSWNGNRIKLIFYSHFSCCCCCCCSDAALCKNVVCQRYQRCQVDENGHTKCVCSSQSSDVCSMNNNHHQQPGMMWWFEIQK